MNSTTQPQVHGKVRELLGSPEAVELWHELKEVAAEAREKRLPERKKEQKASCMSEQAVGKLAKKRTQSQERLGIDDRPLRDSWRLRESGFLPEALSQPGPSGLLVVHPSPLWPRPSGRLPALPWYCIPPSAESCLTPTCV